jgi:hypothetical protein
MRSPARGRTQARRPEQLFAAFSQRLPCVARQGLQPGPVGSDPGFLVDIDMAGGDAGSRERVDLPVEVLFGVDARAYPSFMPADRTETCAGNGVPTRSCGMNFQDVPACGDDLARRRDAQRPGSMVLRPSPRRAVIARRTIRCFKGRNPRQPYPPDFRQILRRPPTVTGRCAAPPLRRPHERGQAENRPVTWP